VVSSLNSGLSMRNLDEGIVRSQGVRAGTGQEVWDTRSGVSRAMMPLPAQHVRPASEPSGRTPSSDRNHAMPRAATPVPTDSAPVALPSTPAQQVPPAPSVPVDLKQRSAAATFAWVLFVMLLLGGGAVLAYTMLGDDSRGPAAQAASDQGSAALAPPAKSDAPEKTHAHPAPNPPTQHAVQVAPPSPAHAPVAHTLAAAEDNSPKGLIAQSAAAESARDWSQLKSVNEKLEKYPKFAGEAVYEQAWAEFQMNDTKRAADLAMRAGKLLAPHGMKAYVLYADTQFKQGDTARAKTTYLNLRKTADKDMKSVITKKIALCNQTLGLPERDGIKGD